MTQFMGRLRPAHVACAAIAMGPGLSPAEAVTFLPNFRVQAINHACVGRYHLLEPTMNRSMFRQSAVAAVCLSALGGACASPLALSYTVTPAEGGDAKSAWNYTFTLVLDNHDNSWVAGQNFNWITFGDAPVRPSPLAGFKVSAKVLSVGPFTYLDGSDGDHNGPTFLGSDPDYASGGWIPEGPGSTLTWSGKHGNFVGQGSMLFSALLGSGNLPRFEVGTLVAVPEPSPSLLLIAGLVVVGCQLPGRRGSWRS